MNSNVSIKYTEVAIGGEKMSLISLISTTKEQAIVKKLVNLQDKEEGIKKYKQIR